MLHGIPLKNKTKEDERALNEWNNTLPGADLSVYSPLRGDFDHEHDNSAEEVGVWSLVKVASEVGVSKFVS